MFRQEQLLHAANERHGGQIKYLLEQGTDPNVKDTSHSTPLHLATKRGDYETVRLLLLYGANPNVQDERAWTPLHYAVDNDNDEIAQLLLDYSADPKAQDNSKSTPLDIAEKNKNVFMVKLLIDFGVDPEVARSIALRYQEAAESTTSSSRKDILDLLNGIPVTINHPTRAVPMFPIVINGIPLEKKVEVVGHSPSNHILVQSRTFLAPSDVEHLGIQKYLDYVSKNTYLCRHSSEKLEQIRQCGSVIYADTYQKHFKIQPNLKAAIQVACERGPPWETCKVDVIFHEITKISPDQEKQLKDKSHCDKMEISFNTARLSTEYRYLDDVASIDDVRCIERVGKIVLFGNHAKELFGLNGLAASLPLSPSGLGEFVAVADSGLCEGEGGRIHPALQNSVYLWSQIHDLDGSTRDHVGHGTHVCGCIVGHSQRAGTTGTAPRARLIVQSLWRKSTQTFDIDVDLERLFNAAYFHGARVHSNSWGREPELTPERASNAGVVEQQGYTNESRRIDGFVWNNQDMVVCFAAGNFGEWRSSNGGLLENQIGSHAAAKNCITVGACKSTRGADADLDSVAAISSRGPVWGTERCKPDIVAPGVNILSTGLVKDHLEDNWAIMDGTSMATAFVAGCAAVLRDALSSIQADKPKIPAALIKALLLNGADILHAIESTYLPSNTSGFGRVNMSNSLAIIQQGDFRNDQVQDETNFTTQPSVWDETIVIKAPGTLKVTLVWTDAPGDKIKNELSLGVERIVGGMKFAAKENNVKQVVWESIGASKVKITVGVIGVLKTPQPFSVVWRVGTNIVKFRGAGSAP